MVNGGKFVLSHSLYPSGYIRGVENQNGLTHIL